MSSTYVPWIVAVIVVVALRLSVKIVQQYERGVLLRLGRLTGIRSPGFNMIIPLVDHLYKIDTRPVTLTVEPQEIITRDNVTIKVDAVVYFAVIDPVKALLQVVDFARATSQRRQRDLRCRLAEIHHLQKRLRGIDHGKIDHRIHLDRHVVPGDDLLGLDRQGHGSRVDLV